MAKRRSGGPKRLQNGTARREKPPPAPPPELPAKPAPLTAAAAGENRAAVLLPSEQTLTFTGKCRLTCLYGSVEVLGFTIAPDQPPYDLFSPHTYCALTVEAAAGKEGTEKSKKEMKLEAKAILRAHLVPREARCRLLKSFVPHCSILLLEQLDTPATKFILSHPEFSQVFRAKKQAFSSILEDPVLASAGLERLEPGRGLLLSQSMRSAIGELIHACQVEDEGCPIILVCGPKSIGKSTFNRYLMNLLLNCLPSLEYLECDLGQPEFTPPGCISLVNVREPLLGPPFTHQRPPRKMAFYGDNSCEHDTERYLDTLKYVFGGYERDVPLLVNTMGWVKGAGLLLLIDTIRVLSPTHVVQLSTEDFKDMPQLSADYIRGTAGLHTRGKPSLKRKNPGGSWEHCRNQRGSHAPQPGHQLLCVQPNFPGAGVPGKGRAHSSTLRSLTMVGYLGQLQPPDLEAVVPLPSLVPYQVPFSAVVLKVIHVDVEPTHILCSLNASWVGLCHLPDQIPCKAEGPVVLTQTPLCDCLGFGIVRGVEMTRKLYYILTPVAPEILRRVNCLLIGNIAIPNCIFLNQARTGGEIPYVTSDYNYDVSGAGKLKIKKHLQRREHRHL
ncbi:polynucleotide 5'-hydroxyl-kinase NOL9 [Protobothrops mucrosquamatus]|uniref:polynucleotide 5'-hydroxyl-kinase NOL9 n=1 Tax=Protobothrops mucrosquamatus TaxID=103944 RepID=UPI0010FB5218|nr:polynucleotide 5'-hydroxyl-kinase NOL9 [Protobothrops mucrosquamatus]